MNRNQLKYIAVFAMLIDHIAWAFVPVASPKASDTISMAYHPWLSMAVTMEGAMNRNYVACDSEPMCSSPPLGVCSVI